MRLHPSRLSLLVEAADRGSIAAVARARDCTGSAVSQQLSLLEREVGAPLLERTPRGVSLTPLGERVVGHARRAMRVLEEAERDVAAALGDGRPAGPVTIGAVASAAAGLVSPAVHAVRRAHPRVTPQVRDLDPSASLRAVRLGDLDLAVVDRYDHVTPAPEGGVRTQELLTEPLVLVLPADAEVPDGPLPLATFAEHDWVAAPPDAACGEAVRSACHAAGFTPQVRWATDDLYLSVHHVAAGHGVALLPLLAARGPEVPVVLRPVADAPLRRTLLAVTREEPTPGTALAAVLAAIRTTAAELHERLRDDPVVAGGGAVTPELSDG